METAAPKLRRTVLIAAAVWSLLQSLVFALIGAAILTTRAYDTGERSMLSGVLFIAFALFLMAFAAGILKEQAWAWYAGFVAVGASLLFGVQDLFRRSWGAAAFDVVYAAALVGVLLWGRKAGREGTP